MFPGLFFAFSSFSHLLWKLFASFDSSSLHDLMAPQRVSSAAMNAFNDDVSIIELPTFGKGGKKHACSANAVVCGDGSERQKAVATKKPSERPAKAAAKN